jgi:GAF domain-containing protein
MSHASKMLGTFGMYYREVRQPGPGEIQLIDYASRIAGIAIERDRSQAWRIALPYPTVVLSMFPSTSLAFSAPGAANRSS